MDTEAPRQSPAHLPWIDGLRGIAVLGVMAVHSGVAYFGSRGVQLFFFASAFTLLVSLQRRHEPILFFYIRRLFRIAPMFYLALAFYSFAGEMPNASSIIATLSFAFALTPWTIWSAVPGGWSVGEEFLFYALLPTTARHVSTLPRSILCFLVLASIGRFAFVSLIDALAPTATSDESWRSSVAIWLDMPTFFTAFAAGIVFFHLRASFVYAWIQKNIRTSGLEIILIVVTVHLAWRLVRYGHDVVPIVIDFIPIGVCLSLGAGRWLISAPIRYVGRISYSCYLVHFAVLSTASSATAMMGLSGHAGAVAKFCVVVATTVAVSSITYILIEQRGIRLGEALIRKLKVDATVPGAPPNDSLDTGTLSGPA